jgi:hypothetical protein
MGMMMLHGDALDADQSFGEAGGLVVGMKIVHHHLRVEFEQALQMLGHGDMPGVTFQIAEVAEVLAEIGAIVAGETEGILQRPAESENRRGSDGKEDGAWDLPARAA